MNNANGRSNHSNSCHLSGIWWGHFVAPLIGRISKWESALDLSRENWSAKWLHLSLSLIRRIHEACPYFARLLPLCYTYFSFLRGRRANARRCSKLIHKSTHLVWRSPSILSRTQHRPRSDAGTMREQKMSVWKVASIFLQIHPRFAFLRLVLGNRNNALCRLMRKQKGWDAKGYIDTFQQKQSPESARSLASKQFSINCMATESFKYIVLVKHY